MKVDQGAVIFISFPIMLHGIVSIGSKYLVLALLALMMLRRMAPCLARIVLGGLFQHRTVGDACHVKFTVPTQEVGRVSPPNAAVWILIGALVLTGRV